MSFVIDFGVLVGLTVALVELFKYTLNYSDKAKRFAPLVALLVGVGLSFLQVRSIDTVTLFYGLIVGLSSSGLYSGTQSITR